MSTNSWYSDAIEYWSGVEATVDGMLGGFEHLSELDARDSLQFLNEYLVDAKSKPRVACDCGAGIGRVTETFLLNVCDRVDLVEQNEEFLNKARVTLTGKDCGFIAQGLQNFTPETHRYDLVWCQWVLGHLTDSDLVLFLRRLKASLKPEAIVGIKENILGREQSSDYVVDHMDSSATRSDALFKKIFKRAGLTLLKEQLQSDFPDSMYPVKMYILH